MKTRANESVYWPGMNASICNYRNNCVTCSRNAPSLPHEPIQMTPTSVGWFSLLNGMSTFVGYLKSSYINTSISTNW